MKVVMGNQETNKRFRSKESHIFVTLEALPMKTLVKCEAISNLQSLRLSWKRYRL